MTSRAALDAQHGRQGGRVVPWDRAAPPFRIGSRRILDAGPGGRAEVTVVSHLAGRRLLVRFDSGATLIVPIHLTHHTGPQ